MLSRAAFIRPTAVVILLPTAVVILWPTAVVLEEKVLGGKGNLK